MIFELESRDAPHLFALPPGRPFFSDLVAALLADFGDDPGRLTGIRIFVPSRRAVRALKEAFALHAGSDVMLLPRISATADLSEDDPLILTHGRSPLTAKAPSAAAKRLKLAGLYREAAAERASHLSWYGALRASSELVRTSDQLIEYGVSADALANLAPGPELENSAAHWREIASLLSLVTQRYPDWLTERAMIDPRARRAILLDQLADGLNSDDHAPLILAAGFLGTSPSSQTFLRRVASLKNGAVVLPALDRSMPETAWDQIEAPHPQAAYKSLFEETFGGLKRDNIASLPYTEDHRASARRELISLALTPAEATADWAHELDQFRQRHDPASALEGLTYAVARTSEEEADFIALALREVLTQPARTAAFVTADRNLARRVAGKLQGWGIDIDDSGGAPIRGSYRATFLRLIAQLMAEPSDPAALAGLIHHQLFGLGLASKERRPLVSAFDRFLRGRKPRAGWQGLLLSLDDAWRPYQPGNESRKSDRAQAGEMLLALRRVFVDALSAPTRSVETMLRAHLTIAEALAGTDRENGRERLFRYEDGEVLEPHLDALLQNADLLGDCDPAEYGKVFDALLEGPVFRAPGGQHPRLSIFGVLESRLQPADLYIIGGLQEGVWPGDSAIDPFLSRAMRVALDLPLPEADIGRLAHDFLDIASKPEVLLTRAARRGSAPARASRLMLRLESFLAKIDAEKTADQTMKLRAWREARYSDHERPKRATPPAPAPPSAAKPDRISVTSVAKWLRDPYAIFARYILKLSMLRSYDEAFSASHRGDMLHKLLEEFSQYPHDEAGPAFEDVLRALLPDALEQADMPHEQRILNAKFIDSAIASFSLFESQAVQCGKTVEVEASGTLELEVDGRTLTFSGRADRIDQFKDGSFHIIDYKLSDSTSIKQGKKFSPQLFMLALMMERGGFVGVEAGRVAQLSYLPLNRGEKPLGVFTGKDEAAGWIRGDALREALKVQEDNLTEWLRQQYAEGTEFPSQLYPLRTDIVGEYDDLARRTEWAAGGDDD